MTRALILALIASPALAQSPVCAPRAEIVGQLAAEYDEHRVGAGYGANTVTEVFASPAGTWTILITRPDGTFCAVAAGEGWMTEAPQTGEQS